MLKKCCIYSIMFFVLIAFNYFGIEAYAETNGNTPRIISLSFDKSQVTMNGDVILTMVIEGDTELKLDSAKIFNYTYVSIKNGDDSRIIKFEKQDAGIYTAKIHIYENYTQGKYIIDYVNILDKAGNESATFDYQYLGFTVYTDLELYSIPSLDNTYVVDGKGVIKDISINGDLFIAPNAQIKLYNINVTGDIFVYGKMIGKNSQAESIHAKKIYNSSDFMPSKNGEAALYNNTFSNEDISSNYDIDYIPIRIDNVQLSNGKIYISGIMAKVADLYFNNILINVNSDGKFVINQSYSGDLDTVSFEFRTVFKNKTTRSFSINNVNDSKGFAPIIYAFDETICVDSPIKSSDSVYAYDKEDGVIEKSITLDISNVENKPGTYVATYHCQDSDGNISEKDINITIRNHNYELAGYDWENDGSKCVINRVCSFDKSHEISNSMIVTSKTIKDATCINKGITLYTAEYNGYSSTKEIEDIDIDPDNHVGEKETRNSKLATCAETGYTGDIYCVTCGNIIEKGSIINKKNHTVIKDEPIEPTYEQTGLTEGSHCSVCGEVIIPQEVIPKKEKTTELATGKFKLLKDFILKQKTTDIDGNRCIVVQLNDNQLSNKGKATIGYNANRNEFVFWHSSYPLRDPSNVSSSKMVMGENGSDFIVVTCSSYITFASTTLDVQNYTSDTLLNFDMSVVTSDVELQQKTYNDILKIAFYGWDLCLLNNFGLDINMANLGFVSYENQGDHTWDNGVVTRESTHYVEGVITYTCTICGECKTESIPKLDMGKDFNESGDLSQHDVDESGDALQKFNYEHETQHDDYFNKSKNVNPTDEGKKLDERNNGSSTGEFDNAGEESRDIKYNNEWVDGKWYNADGSQTYTGTLSWKANSTGWWVEDSDGWYPVSSWQKIDGNWYYFNASGYMASNEYVDGYWLNGDGSCSNDYYLTWKSNSSGWWVEDVSGWWPSNKWLKIDSCWYYFDSSGYMVTNKYIDGYWIGANGVCQ